MMGLNGAILVETIEEYRDSISVLDSIYVEKYTGHEDSRTVKKRIKAIVLAKYPNIVDTTDGTFSWKDIYFWNRGTK